MTVRVSIEDLDYGADGLYYLGGEPFTGTIEYISDGGWVEAGEEYEDGLLSGTKREWQGKGILWREAECAFGGRHGRCKEWDEAGHLVADDKYEFGVRVSGKRWDCDGRLIEDFVIQEGAPSFQLLASLREAHRRGG